MRRWRQWIGTLLRRPRMDSTPMRTVEPIKVSDLTREVPGKWVAVREHEIVEVGDTLDQLMHALADRCITDVTVMRAASEAEAELVGLG